MMRRPLSLSLRLTLLFGIASTSVFLVFGWVIDNEIEAHFAEEDISEMQLVANAVERLLSEYTFPEKVSKMESRFDDLLVGHHEASLYIADESGETVYISPGLKIFSDIIDRTSFGSENQIVKIWEMDNLSFRVMTQHIPGNRRISSAPYTIAVAVSIEHHLHFLTAFRHTLWLMISLTIASMSVIGWIAVRQGHAPLHEIVARIRLITANALTTSIPPESLPEELADLAVSFNEMLKRVDASFQRLTDFNADIAHELRTPITNLMTQSQVVLSKARTIEQYREILYSNMEEYERMAQMVGDMLFLAQTDNKLLQQNVAKVDLLAEVQDLFDYYDGWAEERHVNLVKDGAGTCYGDRLMLRRALSNLLSNAIRHTPPTETVTVDIHMSSNSALRISVKNPGLPIPTKDIHRIFDRFYRTEASRQQQGAGAGLGLAIVKSIIEAHRGTIEVQLSQGHTCFVISLPTSKESAITNVH